MRLWFGWQLVCLDADDSHATEELVSGNTAEQLSKDVRDKVGLLDFLCHPHSHSNGRVEGSAADCSTEQNGESKGCTDCVCVSGGEDHIDQGKCADELNNKLLHLIVGIHKKLMTQMSHGGGVISGNNSSHRTRGKVYVYRYNG